MSSIHDVIVVGGGASGLMCALEAGRRGRGVLVLEHGARPGSKILISGGGHCNFTNRHVTPENFLSGNPHFCRSALARYTAAEFLELVERHNITHRDKGHGQLFCLGSSKQILQLLLRECSQAGVEIRTRSPVRTVEALPAGGFLLQTDQGELQCRSLVVATGGLSLPRLGASPWGFELARQFGLKTLPARAGLVPFTLHRQDRERFAPLAGVSMPVIASNPRASFREDMLFTHRGLSGPAILQLSSYWRPGEEIQLDLLPDLDLEHALREAVQAHPRRSLRKALGEWLPRRLAERLLEEKLANRPLHTLSPADRETLIARLHDWRLVPAGTEGYATAEVTLGGVDCNELSSRTMEARKVPGLYFIGEVVDVSGHLGGFNFQWAWSSGWCAGQVV